MHTTPKQDASAVSKPNLGATQTAKPKMWGPSAAIFVSIAAYVVSQLILVLPIGVISFLKPGENIDTLITGSSWVQFVLAIFSALGLLLTLWLFLRIRRQGFGALGFKKPKASDFGWLAFSVVLYIILLTIGMVLASNIPGFDADQQQDIGYQGGAPLELIIAFFGLVVLPPLAEEMLFRGFMYRGLASRWPKIIAAVVTSLLFALVHFQWNVGVDVFILSMVLIFLYERTKNLWMCIFLHGLKNGLAFIVLFFMT